jgi:RNA-directed DNA polymerase
MKRANNLIEKIAEIENLRLAFWKARKGKSYTQEVELYRKDLEINLLELQHQILQGEVKVGNYYYFKIYEPKERQICASAFSEQVLHHALMNICDPRRMTLVEQMLVLFLPSGETKMPFFRTV